MKYVLGAISFCVCLIVGYYLTKRYDKKVAFLKEYRDFLTLVSSEVTFFQKKMKEVADAFSKEKKTLFCRLLQEGKKEYPTKEEKLVLDFLTQANEIDKSSQNDFITFSKEVADKAIQEAEQKEKTEGGLIKKICPLIGIALFLLFL